MTGESTGRKIWRVIYPVIALFVLYFGVIYGAMLIFPTDAGMEQNFAIIVAAALIIISVVEFLFFRSDAPVQSKLVYKQPVWILLLILLGAAASHGLNLLVSLFNINGIFGSYEAVQAEIFAPGAVWVIVRAVILAPIAEELVFRGLTFRRMREYTGFWPAALVSAALFGLYHMNLGQGIYAFIFGILLAAVYDRFQNLLAPVLIHFAANALSVILQYTNAQYPSTLWYVVSMVCMFLLTAAILIFGGRRLAKQKG